MSFVSWLDDLSAESDDDDVEVQLATSGTICYFH